MHAHLARANQALVGQDIVYPPSPRGASLYRVVIADKDGIVARLMEGEHREFLIAAPTIKIGIVIPEAPDRSGTWSTYTSGV